MKNKNRFLKVTALALAFALSFSCVAASADDITVGNLEYVVIEDTDAEGGKVILDAIGEDREEIYREGSLGSVITTGDIVAPEGGYDPPVEISAEYGAVTVNTGNVTNTNGIRPAVNISTGSDDAEVTFGSGDISASATGVAVENKGGTVSATTGSIDAAGIGVHFGEEELTTEKPDWNPGTTTLTVNGDINVTAGDEDGAEFLDAGVLIEEASLNTDTVIVNGNITVEGSEDQSAVGVSVITPGDAAVEVNGDITVKGNYSAGVQIGNDASEDGPSGTVTATLTGDIEVDGVWASGVTIFSGNGGTAELDMEGSITVTGAEEGGYAAALFTGNDGGTTDAAVTGDLTSSGTGIEALDHTARWDNDTEQPEEYGTLEVNEDELIRVLVLENGTEEKSYAHTDGDTISYYNEDGQVTRVENKVTAEEAGTTRIEVVGDVTAGGAGILIDLMNDKARMDVIVDGTVSGDTQSVLLSRDTVTDGLVLTVWEIKPNDAGNLVERQTYQTVSADEGGEGTWETAADAETEKKIQYIIKIEPTQTDIINTTGTTEYEGYNVALEGDTVTLKLNIPEGYEVLNAFNGTDEKVELLQDENGDYYLVVPRGGAVMLSVEMEKIPEPTPPTPPAPTPEPGPADPAAGGVKPAKAIVVIDLNGGTLDGQTGTITVATYIGGKINLPDAPEKEGCEFVGWNVQEVAQDDPEFRVPDENAPVNAAGSELTVLTPAVTVTAVWKTK